MTFGIFLGDFVTTLVNENAYLEFFLPDPLPAFYKFMVPPPSLILPDPRVLCCFSEQIRCIEINGRQLTMLSGKAPVYEWNH